MPVPSVLFSLSCALFGPLMGSFLVVHLTCACMQVKALLLSSRISFVLIVSLLRADTCCGRREDRTHRSADRRSP